jgi:hypothetical protein
VLNKVPEITAKHFLSVKQMTATAPAIQFDASLFNPKYIELLHEYVPFLHLFGSAGSGKSVFAAQKEIVYSYFPWRAGRNTLVLRKLLPL